MIKSPHKSCGFPAWLLALLLLAGATLGVSAAGPKRVLILDPFGRNVAPFTTVVSSFRTTLARELGEPVDIYELPLELTRFSGTEGETPLVTFLEGRLKEQPVDLVVPVGTAGMQFAARHRDRLFPMTPVVVLGAEPRMLSPELLRTNATAVAHALSLPGMVEDILQLQPQTTNIVVVLGASALERYWTERCRREFQVFTNRVGFTWVNDLTMEQILKSSAALPPRSFILHVMFIVDAAGVPCERNEVLRRLHADANAPVFGYFASEFGLGSIGGRLLQDAEMGAQAAHTAVRLLHGERPERIPVQILEATVPTYDWRELRRWGISEANLPAGSIIKFRQPGFWERYGWLVAGAGLFCFLQAALIVGLLVNRSKLRQREAEAKLIADISSKFVNVPPDAVDREIMEAERRICESLGLDVGVLWQWTDGNPGCFTLTHFYSAVDRPQTPEGMSSHETFPWVEQEVLAGRIVALSTLDALPAEASRDREFASQMGIKSSLTIPLSVGGQPAVGALCFNTLRTHRDWPKPVVARLQLVAQVFSNALARKRADQALRESEERMTLAANAAQFGVWVWNIAHNQVWGSERWPGLFGFVAGKDVSFEAVMEGIHPDDRETVEREVRHALATRSDYAGEFRAVLPDGTLRWIASRGRGYPDASGAPIRMVGAAIDITERKHGEEALRLSEARLAASVDLAGLAFVEVDESKGTVFADDRAYELLGVPRDRNQGLQFVEFWKEHVHPDDAPWVLGERRQAIDGKIEQLSVDYRYRHPARGEIWIQHLGRATTRDAAGFAVSSFGVLRDITERKRSEDALLRQRAELAHLSRVAMLGELSGSMAHELNQPLTAILSNAQAAQRFLAGDEADLGEVRDILADIVAEDKRAGEIIRRLRLLLKKGEVQHQPLNMNEVVQEVLKLVRSDLVNQNVTMETELAPGLPVVHGDRVQLQQVLLNLVMNGCEAMAGTETNARQLTIRTDRSEDGSVRVSVADGGPGIAPEKLEQIFESFYTTKPQGMGLGLTVCRTIITAHRGKLWATSKPGRGATVCFTLPANVGQ